MGELTTLKHRLLSLSWAHVFLTVIVQSKKVTPTYTYNYFAFGSNVAQSTMVNLRNLQPIAYTPAMLTDHRLAFNIPGISYIEPSSASVEPITKIAYGDDENCVVHGILYKLTQDDFATVCSTEGVPFTYALHRCHVIPYEADGMNAGQRVLESQNFKTIPAYTLRAAPQKWRESPDIPPSQSYKNVILRGAKESRLDSSYIKRLEEVECDRRASGFSEEILSVAEMINSYRKKL